MPPPPPDREASVQAEAASANSAVATHAQRRQHDQHTQNHRTQLLGRVREINDSVGTGFLYGTLFGGVVASVEGFRESPKHQRLRGMLHHAKHVIPETAGRIALVTGLFRLASWGLEAVRGGRERADLWDVLLAAPIAGAMFRIRQGPRAAARTAVTFGSVGAVMVVFNLIQAKAGRHHDSPDDILEEIAFAEEFED